MNTPSGPNAPFENFEQPSASDWKSLYKAADAFIASKCWEWIDESVHFGVQPEAKGEILYPSVMGASGQGGGLTAFRGSSGLNTYMMMASGEIPPDSPESLFIQECLVATLVNKEYLEEDDLQAQSQAGVSYSDDMETPRFRSYKRGYVPWFFTKQECQQMTVVLEQTTVMAQRIKSDGIDSIEPKEEGILVRTPSSISLGRAYIDEWIEPPPAEDLMGVVGLEAEAIRQITSLCKQSGKWEMDVFSLPAAVNAEPRPFFATMAIVVDSETGEVIGQNLTMPDDRYMGMANTFLGSVESTQVYPKSVLIRRQAVAVTLNKVFEDLKIEVELNVSSPAVEAAHDALLQSLIQQQRQPE